MAPDAAFQLRVATGETSVALLEGRDNAGTDGGVGAE